MLVMCDGRGCWLPREVTRRRLPRPAAQKPPATPPAAVSTRPPRRRPRAAEAAAAPFPEGAKFAFIDIQAVASNSAEGKAATAKLDDLRKKKNAELLAKNTRSRRCRTS